MFLHLYPTDSQKNKYKTIASFNNISIYKLPIKLGPGLHYPN